MWLFLANKPLGIVHWHAEIHRKLQILYTECSKKLTHIVTFSAPNVLNPLPSLNMHLIIKNALLWDQKFLNWRDLSIFKNAILVLSSTTVYWSLIVDWIIKIPNFYWYLEIFLSEAVDTRQCCFFENRLIKLKCLNLLNVLLPKVI